MRLISIKGTATASARTLRRLNQDYVCAEVGKDLAAKLAAFIREIEHTIRRKHRQPSLTVMWSAMLSVRLGTALIRDSVTFDAERNRCLQSHRGWITKCRIKRTSLH